MQGAEKDSSDLSESIPILPSPGKGPTGLIPAPSTLPSSNSDEVISPSMSLIDESAKLLVDTMRNVKPSMLEDGTTANQLDYHEIDSVCKCAKELREIMRLKLDVLKAGKGR